MCAHNDQLKQNKDFLAPVFNFVQSITHLVIAVQNLVGSGDKIAINNKCIGSTVRSTFIIKTFGSFDCDRIALNCGFICHDFMF